MPNKINHFFITHFTGFEESIFDACKVVSTDDVFAFEFFGIYFYDFIIGIKVFTK